jgi:hypothetical protein
MVVAHDGTVHAAAVLDKRIWWVTNRSGSWTRKGLSDPSRGQLDLGPTIATDGANLYVAFARFDREEGFGDFPSWVYYLERSTGGWSTPETVGPYAATAPDVAVHGGSPRLVYIDASSLSDYIEPGMEIPIHYAARGTGGWDDVIVSLNGTDPTLDVTSDGGFRICFGDGNYLLEDSSLHLAAPEAGGFSVETVPQTEAEDPAFACAVDGDNRSHIVYSAGAALLHARRGGAGWAAADTLMQIESGYVYSVAMAIGPGNAVHVLATTSRDGVWYFTNRHGAWESRQLLPPPVSDGWFQVGSAIDVDATGRAHMMFAVGEGAGTGLYYGVSPGV